MWCVVVLWAWLKGVLSWQCEVTSYGSRAPKLIISSCGKLRILLLSSSLPQLLTINSHYTTHTHMFLQTEFDASGSYKSKGKPSTVITVYVHIYMHM